MKRYLSVIAAISAFATIPIQIGHCEGCQTGSLTITNLPALPGFGYQVFSMNSAGQLTGFFFVAGQHPAHAFVYGDGLLTDLGTLGGSTGEGHWINTSGQIVGKAALPGNSQAHAFLDNNGSLLDLGTLGGPSSTATAINDAGVIIGNSDVGGGLGTSAFISTNGALVSLGNLGSNYSSAFALNNGSLVVGESGVANGDVHGFTYLNGTLSDVGTLGGTYSSAFAVNDAGEVVGESSVDSNGDVNGFVLLGGVMTDVGTFGGTYSSAYLVNSKGQASGVANIAGDLETHGFIYSAGTLTDLGTLGGAYVLPNAINNKGQIVGEALTSGGQFHAFLWDNGTLVDLNSLLPGNSGWQLMTALYINDSGRVVGVGNLAGLSQWFILVLAGSNSAPVAVAGPDQTVDCQSQVTLDGSRSSDPNGNSLTFEWISGGNVLGTSAVIAVSLPIGTNLVTLIVTDPCGGSAQTNLNVIVADTTPPTGSCPAPVTASADANCQAAVPNLVAQVVASDNCTPAQALLITQSPMAGTFVGLGAHPVTITVKDASGNSSTCTVLFTVTDTTPPSILSTPPSFSLSAGSDCQAQVPNVLASVVASDSCTPASQLVKTQNPAAGSLVGIGTHSILISVSDASGNTSTAKVAFTVADTTAPTILSGPSAMKLSADSSCHAAVPNVLSSVLVTDNCTPANQIQLVQNPAAGTVLGSGVYTIVVTATDSSGNSTTLNVPLEIDDTTPPTILSSPGPLTISANGQCQGTVPNVLANVVATDNCTPAAQLVMTQNPVAGTVLPDGQYTVVVSVSDASGNVATTSIPLTIVDTAPPQFQALTVSPNVLSPPNHQFVPITVSATVSDNCDPAPLTKIVSITCDDRTCDDDIQITGNLTARLAASKNASGATRTYTITVLSTDASGNSSSATVTVTVPKNGNTVTGSGTSSIIPKIVIPKISDNHPSDDDTKKPRH
jgi:probable HAF family extracellular repeat protein